MKKFYQKHEIVLDAIIGTIVAFLPITLLFLSF
jgi:hypothetical protein